MTNFPIMGMPRAILAQLAGAPSARPEIKFLATFAANSRATHANNVRVVNNARLRQTNLSAALTNAHSPEADTVRRLRLAKLNATSI